jgi:hypothetical protein
MSRALQFFTARRTRLVLTWLVLLSALIHRGASAYINFRTADRPDWNDGHTSIDFGGQYLLGRILVLGHGRELYSRDRHLAVAREAYRHDREPARSTDHDAERLVNWYPGPPADPVAGPLYPPIHAFVMAPIALIDDPYHAYRVTQVLMIGLILLAGWGVRYLSQGRWWWSAATSLLLLFPGCRGGISLAQNSALSVCVLIWGWALLVRGRPILAGVLLGMLAFKPVWAISFLAALLLLKQWRAALAMAGTGAALIVITLPIVGIHSWFDWLHIGQLAAETYRTDRNWIFLSRDLFGIPRRIFLEFNDGRAVSDRPIASWTGWLLWSFVAITTTVCALIALRRKHGPERTTGILAGFVLLGVWMCTYRFMYYDALLASLAVIAIMLNPRPFFRQSWWPFASCVGILVGVLLLIENVLAPLNVELTGNLGGLKGTVTSSDGSTRQTAPRFVIASGDYYPWDTATLFVLWVWCAVKLLRGRHEPLAPVSTVPSTALPINSA